MWMKKPDLGYATHSGVAELYVDSCAQWEVEVDP